MSLNSIKKIFILQIAALLSAGFFVSCVSDDFTYLQTSEDEENEIEVADVQDIYSPISVTESVDGTCSIYIRTDIPKANIYLNKNYQGRSPLVLKNLIPGYYTLTVEFSQTAPKSYVSNFLIEIENGKVQEYYIERPDAKDGL